MAVAWWGRLAGLMMVLATPAAAGDLDRIRADLARLDGQVQLAQSLPNSSERLTLMEGELRRLTGKVEELEHRIRQVEQRVELLGKDVDLRLRDVESSGGGSGGSVAAPAPAPSVSGSPRELYDEALARLRQADYLAAEERLQALVQNYPDDALAPNAYYWLGETYYVRGDFEQAARVFAEAYQAAPQGPKAADDLLKLAMSLAHMGRTQDACTTLKTLRDSYATANPAVHARGRQESTRLGCPY